MSVLRVLAHSALALGGTSSPDPGFDRTTARDAQGRPFVPGSALRGALRGALERLLRGTGGQACDPNAEGNENCSCAVCDLFGNSERPGVIRIGNATLSIAQGAPPDLSARTSVSIDRARRSARRGRLFSQQTSAVGEALLFEAPLTCARALLPLECTRLEAACRATFALGSSRSRGAGFVEISVDWDTASRVEVLHEVSVAGPRTLEIEAELLEPVHISTNRPRANYHTTATWVPGSTLRGALGTALAECGLSGDSAFSQLFGDGPETGASFGDLRPTREVQPSTLRQCRLCSLEGRTTREDLLLVSWARSKLADLGVAHDWRRPCLVCGGERWDTLPAYDASGLRRRLWTRVALDRSRGRAADGRLHALEVIDPCDAERRPVRLHGTLSRVTSAAAQLLQRLGSRPVHLGKGRARGLGAVRLTIRPARAQEQLSAVAQALAADAARRAALIEKRLGLAARALTGASGLDWLVPVTVSSRWVLPGAADPAAHPLHELGVSPPILATRIPVLHGGWDLRGSSAGRERLPRPAFEPGGVFLYRVPPDTDISAWQAAGQVGTGAWTALGCGRFVLFHPAHRVSTTPPTTTKVRP